MVLGSGPPFATTLAVTMLPVRAWPAICGRDKRFSVQSTVRQKRICWKSQPGTQLLYTHSRLGKPFMPMMLLLAGWLPVGAVRDLPCAGDKRSLWRQGSRMGTWG